LNSSWSKKERTTSGELAVWPEGDVMDNERREEGLEI